MSIPIRLDQKECQELFKPGGNVKIIFNDKIVYGFLFKWIPGETDFYIIDSNGIHKIEYFRCKQIWYTPAGKSSAKFKKVLRAMECGKKIKKPLTADHANQLKHLIHEVDSLTQET